VLVGVPTKAILMCEGQEHERVDVFLSFHGSERLCLGRRHHDDDDDDDDDTTEAAAAGVVHNTTMRDLVRGLGPGGVLQECWAESGRFGSLAIFFDSANVGAQPDANIPETLKQGLLQTRGGGIVAILATPGYFTSRSCRAELRAAHVLATTTSSAPTERVNLCIVGVCIKEATLRSGLAALNLPGVADFQYKLVPCLQQDANLLRGEIADVILSQGSSLVPGKTKKASLGDMLVETYAYLQRLGLESSLRDAFALTSDQQFLLTELIANGHSVEAILSILDECFRKHPVYAHAACCRARLEAFRCKWVPKAWSGDVVDAVSRIMAEALVEQQDAAIDSAAPTKPTAAPKKRAQPTSVASCRGTADIVGVDFCRSRSEELVANAVRDEERLRGLLQQLADFGQLRRDDYTVRRVRTSFFTERCVLRLTYKVELREDLQLYEQKEVRDILSCIYDILVDCAPPTNKKAADEVILGALYKACLCLVVEMSSAILDALVVKLAESGMRLPIGYGEAYITGIYPMWHATLTNSAKIDENAGIDFPTSGLVQEKDSIRETEPDVWLLGMGDAHLLVPNSSKALDCILSGGVNLKELAIDNGVRLDMWLPQIQFAERSAITTRNNLDNMDEGEETIKERSRDYLSSEGQYASISSLVWSPSSQRIAFGRIGGAQDVAQVQRSGGSNDASM
jgi:hypothetical protein